MLRVESNNFQDFIFWPLLMNHPTAHGMLELNKQKTIKTMQLTIGDSNWESRKRGEIMGEK